jgi:hypothetical protein
MLFIFLFYILFNFIFLFFLLLIFVYFFFSFAEGFPSCPSSEADIGVSSGCTQQDGETIGGPSFWPCALITRSLINEQQANE